jgi:uncharacterized FlaG/YvyC family protein
LGLSPNHKKTMHEQQHESQKKEEDQKKILYTINKLLFYIKWQMSLNLWRNLGQTLIPLNQ